MATIYADFLAKSLISDRATYDSAQVGLDLSGRILMLGGLIKKSRFAESQILLALKEADAEDCGKTLTRSTESASDLFPLEIEGWWGTVSEVKRPCELEAENAKLKRVYADLALENTAIKDVLGREL